MVREVYSETETRELAKELASKAKGGDVFALTGDLGTGKTAFAKGFAEGLGIHTTVNSPTFTILQEYTGGRLPFYHFDVYRIEEPDEMLEVGFEDYIRGDGVSLVEWADLIPELLPEDTIHVTLQKELSKGTDYRRITVEGINGE